MSDWNDFKPYTGCDFIADSIRQARELAEANEAWLKAFLADDKRMDEWRLP